MCLRSPLLTTVVSHCHSGPPAAESSFAFHHNQTPAASITEQQQQHDFYPSQHVEHSTASGLDELWASPWNGAKDKQMQPHSDHNTSKHAQLDRTSLKAADPQQLADHLAQLKQEFKDICSGIFDDDAVQRQSCISPVCASALTWVTASESTLQHGRAV